MHVGVEADGKQPACWFDLHTPSVRNEPKSWDAQYASWLMAGVGRSAPVMVQDLDPRPTQSQPFPRETIRAWLHARGASETDYITSSGAWMFVYALSLGATTIGLWGMNYEDRAEYVVQRPCMEYWIGFARALGVSVYITPTSRLCRDRHVYGFDGHRADLQQTGLSTAVRLTTAQVMTGRLPTQMIPPDVQALIDEEREVFGIDTHAEWAKHTTT
jgi:hypothetical protein